MIRKTMLIIACSLTVGGCFATFEPPRVVLSDYAQNCRIIKLSRSDTPATQKSVLVENNKCRAAVAAEAPTR